MVRVQSVAEQRQDPENDQMSGLHQIKGARLQKSKKLPAYWDKDHEWLTLFHIEPGESAVARYRAGQWHHLGADGSETGSRQPMR